MGGDFKTTEEIDTVGKSKRNNKNEIETLLKKGILGLVGGDDELESK